MFSDGADLDSIIEAYSVGLVKGFTTNPTLMSKAGITNYIAFATEVLRVVTDLSVSFEVFSDDFASMKEQALQLAKLADNVYVKIPVTNTKQRIGRAAHQGSGGAGAEAERDGDPVVAAGGGGRCSVEPGSARHCFCLCRTHCGYGARPYSDHEEVLEILKPLPKAELLWASPREALNIIQAEEIGCHIITVTPAVLAKTKNFNKDLDQFSLETVKMFYNDATEERIQHLKMRE